MTPTDILHFWFEAIDPAAWWRADPAFDAHLRDRYGACLAAARAGELHGWRATAEGRLAEVIVLDQFSRNVHRGTPEAFSADPMALALAQEAVAGGHDRALKPPRLTFIYMPFMHSESRAIHVEAERLFSQPGLEGFLDSERRHRAIVDRFGRYPHRNAILGRESTPEEAAFLLQPGSRF